jgi:hypothetical protein
MRIGVIPVIYDGPNESLLAADKVKVAQISVSPQWKY